MKALYGRSTDTTHYCVVSDEAGAELHHLHEARSESRDPFKFVPISSDLNGKIERRDSAFTEELGMRLVARARDQHALGNFGRAYGCSILGVWLARRPFKGGTAVLANVLNHAADCLLNLRPLDRVDAATALLREIVVPELEDAPRRLGYECERALTRVAMEVGSYFRDASEPALALRFTEATGDAFGRIGLDGAANRRILHRSQLHRAIALVGMGCHDSAREALVAAAETAAGDRVADANTRLWRARSALASPRRDADEAFDLVRQFWNGGVVGASKWTQFEALLLAAEAAELIGSRRLASAEGFERQAAALRAEFNIVPTRVAMGARAPVAMRQAINSEFRIAAMAVLTRLSTCTA